MGAKHIHCIFILSSVAVFCSCMPLVVSGCFPTERSALLEFRQGLEDPADRLSSWAAHDCCSWEGVACDNRTGHVVELDLHNLDYSLVGELRPALLGLKYSKYLDLSMNYFEEKSIPAFVGSLRNLKYLNLSYAGLSGTVPRQLGNLSSLESLDLSGSIDIDDALWISRLSSLKQLNMNEVQFSEDAQWLSALNMLPRISEMRLSWAGLKFPPSLPHANFTSLTLLDLSGNSINSAFPSWLFNISSLKHLDLRDNLISGPIPSSIGLLASLQELYFSNNELNGTIPEALWKLGNMVSLDLSFNKLEGAVSESHLDNLSKLQLLDLSSNSLEISVISDWIPPFQLLLLDLSHCEMGPEFPSWLRQQEKIEGIDISNAGISDYMPVWFWNFSRNLTHIDISNNEIKGRIPDLSRFPSSLSSIDLSNNSFSGSIDPRAFCELQQLYLLDLSGNALVGELPNCWGSSSSFLELNFADNNFSGVIPSSMGSQLYLVRLKLSNNSLSGEIPLSLKNCTMLEILDVGSNKITGDIPTWIGESLLSLRVLGLRSNILIGHIPPNLSNLNSLTILDLADNHLSGTIPSSFGYFSAMNTMSEIGYGGFSYGDIQLVIKGSIWKYYDSVESPLTIIDLSSNDLSGIIPKEITRLSALFSLNLSHNHLMGMIPKEISFLRQLESLDLSRNNISGEIPPSIDDMSSLGYLNLSYNELTGKIPTGNHIETFTDPSVYVGNLGLCGSPLMSCEAIEGSNVNYDREDGKEMIWFYISMAPGFVVGFWAFCGPLLLNRKWLIIYFRFIDKMFDGVYVFVTLKLFKPKI